MRARANQTAKLAVVLGAALCVAAPAGAAAHASRGTRARTVAVAKAIVHHYRAALTAGVTPDCQGPAANPQPGSQAWTQRDAENQYCATERLQDEYANPAFGSTFWSQTPGIFTAQNLAMAMDPTHPHVSLAQVTPGGTTADPYRTLDRWTAAGRGRVQPVSFPATDGATLNGYVFEPPASVHGRYPAVVITTGSIQGYQQLYFWAAEGLAEAGYMVLTYDVQGQGSSDTFPAMSNCTGLNSCTGVPFQQSYNFYQGTEDALNYLFSTPQHPYTSPGAPGQSTYNPAYAALDPGEVGIAGHSLGASAVSQVGQCDRRVKAIVAWDNLAPTSGTCDQPGLVSGFPAGTPLKPTNTVPALGFNSEYFFNPQPMSSPPDPQSKAGAYQQLKQAGTDTMQVALRSSMHLEYTYVPYILPASRLGERVAFYYTLAWMNRYVRGEDAAYDELVGKTFDGSSDAHSIGAGGYDPAAAAANPTDTAAGNVPYKIKGLPVADRLSFYYDSEYSLTKPGGSGKTVCLDMRAACPAVMPQYP
jgi:dienelactone hydrolase